MKQRATELLPQVLLTLQSIIQALALELLWSRVVESDFLFRGDLASLAGWLQVSAITIGIVLVWLNYTGLVMRFAWVPRTRDSIFPFAIGLLEFALIQLTGPQHPAAWVACMGALFAVATYASNDIFVHASKLPSTEQAIYKDNGMRDFHIGMAVAGLHGVLALGLSLLGGFGVAALLCFVLINALLLAQMRIVHVYLQQAITASDGPPEEPAE